MTVDIEKLLAALDGEDYATRRDALRDCCPCRNGNLRDLEVWRAVFDKALRGNMRERDRAAHAIGTLTEKAVENPAWRDVLRVFKTELDALRRDRRASRLLLAQMKKHGHAHRGAAMQGYRRRRKVLDLASPAELAAWVNGQLRLTGPHRVTGEHPGIQRLWRWMKHRVRFQPERRTSEGELARRAARYLPRLFDTNAAATVGATLVVARPKAVHEFGTGRDKPVPYVARGEL